MGKRKEKLEEENSTTSEQNFFNKLAADCSGHLLNDCESRSYFCTGILALNKIISGKYVGGGIPEKTISEVTGPSSTGKSVLGTNFLKGVQKANGISALLDSERAIGLFAVKASKVNPDKLIIIHPDTLNNAFNKMHSIIQKVRSNESMKNKGIGIVYDSIAVSPSEDEYRETEIDMSDATDAEKKRAGVKSADMPGVRAKVCSRELRKLMPIVEKNNATVFIVNQIRKKIGVMYGSPDTNAGGGEALKYYCSTCISISISSKILDSTKKVVGMNTNFVVTKSRFTAPHQRAENVALMFDSGIDPFGGLLQLLIQDKRITGTMGRYQVAEPWAGGREIKFSATKESNKVPIDVLLDCPQLVDAESAEEIEYYIDLGRSTNDAIESGELTQESINSDESES